MDKIVTETESTWANSLFYTGLVIVTFLIYKSWMEGKQFTQNTRVDGKVAIVTGANSGIGFETAVGLAERGCKVIMACRDRGRAIKARDEIISRSGSKDVHFMQLDLSSFRSIREFSKKFLDSESRLDILINNAGVMGVNRELTENGLEMHLGVNHFGHFLLTLLLLDRLKASGPSRIVTVSSLAQIFCSFNKDVNSEKSYNRFYAYQQSKLANIMFTNELSRRLKHSGVTANSLHPGVIYTELSKNLESLSSILNRKLCLYVAKLILRSTKSGAQCTLFCALDFNIQTISGMYFDNLRTAKVNKDALNPELCKWLWDKSEEITGVRFNGF